VENYPGGRVNKKFNLEFLAAKKHIENFALKKTLTSGQWE
jgi:hypothetical protein